MREIIEGTMPRVHFKAVTPSAYKVFTAEKWVFTAVLFHGNFSCYNKTGMTVHSFTLLKELITSRRNNGF